VADKETAERFLALLQAEAEGFNERVSTPDGDWIVKGFIDVFRNVYTISGDTKVVSKLIELMLFPRFLDFAQMHRLKIVPSPEQNYYPDLTFIDQDDHKYAVDLKSTYRLDDERVNTMTLGAFTGYFRNRTSTKNITFPYGEYSGHFVLGVIYTRCDVSPDQMKTRSLDELHEIPSVVRDLQFFAQPKYRIAKDQPGSGNTKNIGAVNTASDLISGTGPFAALGEDVFDDYWMYYLTRDMVRAAELKAAPYTNLQTYHRYRKSPRKRRR
jgi:hypothetical protein